MQASFKYSLVSIRNLFNLTHLDIVNAIHDGYIPVVGDGENVDSYYTNQKGMAFFKKINHEIGHIGLAHKIS